MSSTIKPFPATFYNPKVIKNLSVVICPPYDVIDSSQLKQLRKNSPYNFTRVMLATNRNYRAVGARFRAWLAQGVLTDDAQDCLYLYEQRFQCEGKLVKRYGFLSLLQMNKKGVVFPHEYTLRQPKRDRSRIINEMKANISPIFLVVPKAVAVLERMYKTYSRRKPFLSFRDHEGNTNRIWRISDHKDIVQTCNAIEGSRLVIADGHHRFEVAHDYYRRKKRTFNDLNYILAYVTAMQPGLKIFPTHRITAIREPFPLFLECLRKSFSVKQIGSIACEKLVRSRGAFAFALYYRNKYYSVELKKIKDLDTMAPEKMYRKLDPYLLKTVIFPLCRPKGEIEFVHTLSEARKRAGKSKVAFLLRPVPLKVVCELANKGYRLPQKSTYFYPKVSSGAIVRRFKR